MEYEISSKILELEQNVEKENPIFFSIVIPSYNAENTIKKTLDSVLSQSLTNYEIIIVDDSSTDRTTNIVDNIMKVSSRHIKLIKNKVNYGVSKSRNIGISEAQGTYIAFLDADDEWYTNKLFDDHQYIVKLNLDWIFSNYEVFDENGVFKQRRIRRSGMYDYDSILKEGNPIGLLSVVIKKSIIESEKFSSLHHEDYRLWLNISKKGFEAYNTGKVNSRYNLSKNSLSSQKIKSAIWTFGIYWHETNSSFRTLMLCLGYLRNLVKRKEN